MIIPYTKEYMKFIHWTFLNMITLFDLIPEEIWQSTTKEEQDSMVWYKYQMDNRKG